MFRPGSFGDRRVKKRLAQQGSVLLSSGLHAISVSISVVSPSTVDAPSEQSVRETLPLLPTVAGASAAASLGLPSLGSASATPSTVVSRRQRMKDLAFSDRIVDRIEKSRARSMKAHYKSQWDLFVS